MPAPIALATVRLRATPRLKRSMMVVWHFIRFLGLISTKRVLLCFFHMGAPSFRALKVDQNRRMSNGKMRNRKDFLSAIGFRLTNCAALRLQGRRHRRVGRLRRVGEQAAFASPLQPRSDTGLEI